VQTAEAGVAASRRAEFEARGWLVLRGVVREPDLAALNAVFDGLLPSTGTAADARGSGVTLLPGAARSHPALLAHLRASVAEVAAGLLGARSIYLLQDALLLKRPSAGGSVVALHQDYAYTGFIDPPSLVSVGLALTDATVEHGCLYVVDRSHQWGLVGDLNLFAGALDRDVAARLSPGQRDHLASATVPLEVRAGDVTIHHGLTLHGSGENRSGSPRKAIVTHLFNGDCTLARDRLPPEARQAFTTDARGRLRGPAFPRLFPAGAGEAMGEPV